MAYNVGPIDFSSLGQLPDVYQTARIKQQEQDLGSVDFTDPAAVSKRAGQLIAIGDMEGALKIQQAAQSARALNEQIAQRHMWEQFIRTAPPFPPAYDPMAGGPAVTPDVVNPGAPGPPPGPPAAAPSPFPSGPVPLTPGAIPTPMPGGRASLGAPQQNFADLRSTSEPLPPSLGAVGRMTPSDEIIAAAQRGVGPAPQLPQYAQASPPSMTDQGPSALPGGQLSVTPGGEGRPRLEVQPSQLPDWLRVGAGAPPGVAAAPGPPTAPAAPTPLAPSADTLYDPRKEAARQANWYQEQMKRMGPNTPIPIIQAYKSGLDAAIMGLRGNPEYNTYIESQRQNQRQGRPIQTYDDWKVQGSMAEGTAGEVRDYYKKDYYDPAQAAKTVISNASALGVLAHNPNFLTGEGAQDYGRVANAATSMLRIGQNLGIFGENDVNTYGGQLQNLLKGPKDVSTLHGLALGIANQAVVNLLGGSLGKQISDSDRNFMQKIAPSLMQTKEGFIALSEYLQQISQHAVEAEKVARKYRQDAGVRSNVMGMQDAVDKYVSDNRIFVDANGKLTAAGEKLQAIVDKATGEAPPVVPSGPTTYQKATAMGQAALGTLPNIPSVAEAAGGAGRAINAVATGALAAGGLATPGGAIATGARAVIPAIARGIPSNLGAPAPQAELFPQPGPPPPRPPGAGPIDTASAADRLLSLANKSDVGSMIKLRQSLSPEQTSSVLAAVTQKLGVGGAGEFDLINWAKSYNALSTKAKAGLLGGPTPGSLRSNLEDIAKGNTVEALWRAVPSPILVRALSDPIGASSLASWSRAYNIMERAGMTPQAVARFKLATDNLNNNIGGNLVWTNFVRRRR